MVTGSLRISVAGLQNQDKKDDQDIPYIEDSDDGLGKQVNNFLTHNFLLF